MAMMTDDPIMGVTANTLWGEVMRVLERTEDRIMDAFKDLKRDLHVNAERRDREHAEIWGALHDHEGRIASIEQDDLISSTRKRDIFRTVKALFGGSHGIVTLLAAIVALALSVAALYDRL